MSPLWGTDNNFLLIVGGCLVKFLNRMLLLEISADLQLLAKCLHRVGLPHVLWEFYSLRTVIGLRQ